MRIAAAFLSGLASIGLPALFAPVYGGLGSILMFHRVAELPARTKGFAPHAGLMISPAFLDAVLVRLLERGYDLVSLDEAHRRIEAAAGTAAAARRFACLTFDDGFRDSLGALSVCRRHGAPMTIFLATGLLDRTAWDWSFGAERLVACVDEVRLAVFGREERLPAKSVSEKRLAYERVRRVLTDLGEDAPAVAATLTERHGIDLRAVSETMFLEWREAKDMAKDGLTAFGAHSVRHVSLLGLPERALRDEMEGSRRRIEAQLGRPAAHFAYPFGGPKNAGAREFRMARELGFSTALTTRHGNVMPAHADALHALPRLSVNGRMQTLAAIDLFLSGTCAALANPFRRAAGA